MGQRAEVTVYGQHAGTGRDAAEGTVATAQDLLGSHTTSRGLQTGCKGCQQG